ncbi:MAG: phospholipase D-like domain-containing protein [Wolinella sp.]
MPTVLCQLLFVALFSLSLNAKEEFYLMPEEQKKALDSLIAFIDNTQQSLEIAIYSFTNREISKAIRKAAERGVNVHLIYDESSSRNIDTSTIGYLAKYRDIEVCTMTGERSKNSKYNGLMHMKMAISDNKNLIIGSANWSKSAFESNYETLLITENQEWVIKASNYFKKMKSRCKPY